MHRKVFLVFLGKLGDTLKLISLVRDLKILHCKSVEVNVGTLYPEIWNDCPYLTKFFPEDDNVQTIKLLGAGNKENVSNVLHSVHDFYLEVSRRLELFVFPTNFGGKISYNYDKHKIVSRLDMPSLRQKKLVILQVSRLTEGEWAS